MSGLTYLMYICMYLKPTPVFMYVASVVLGFGAAFIWTAQGEFLHIQSANDESLMAKNTGIFWCMFQSSLLVGNIYIFFAWQGKQEVSSEMRTSLFTIFSVLAAAGCSVFLLLKGPCCSYETLEIDEDAEEDKVGSRLLTVEKPKDESTGRMVLNSIVNAFKLLFTKEMVLIASLFFYSGFELSFFSGVFTTAVGNSNNLPDSSSTVGLVGMMIGIGEVIGGGLFVFGGKLMDKIKRPHLLMG